MAEETQAQQGPTEPKEPQRVTTKDPKKVEAGKRLAAINHKKREAKKRGTSAIGKDRSKLILWHRSCYSSGSDRWPWLLHLSNQERRAGCKHQ